MQKFVLVIGGSDSSGGSGISADLQVLNFLGVHSFLVFTTLTAQNYKQVVELSCVSKKFLLSQLQAIKTYPFDWVKLSLISNEEQIEGLTNFFSQYQKKIIFDPIIQASSGKVFWSEKMHVLIKKKLIPLVHLITPNIIELENLISLKINSHKDCVNACKVFWENFGVAIYLKGGHLQQEQQEVIKDYFYNGEKTIIFSVPFQKSYFNRGSGCRFSSSLAAYLAKGLAIEKALLKAKSYIDASLKSLTQVSENEFLLSVPKAFKNHNVSIEYIYN